MVSSYTAKYTKTSSGYMGQLVEWPEVVTEGRTLEECRDMLRDALREMMAAYRQQGKEVPVVIGVIPAKAGMTTTMTALDSRVRGNDMGEAPVRSINGLFS